MSGRIAGNEVVSYNPATGVELGRVPLASTAEYDAVLAKASETLERWRMLPAPQRGEIVRQIGDELRQAKQELGKLVTLEAGKIVAEAFGYVDSVGEEEEVTNFDR